MKPISYETLKQFKTDHGEVRLCRATYPASGSWLKATFFVDVFKDGYLWHREDFEDYLEALVHYRALGESASRYDTFVIG